jgi:hypothetical protein
VHTDFCLRWRERCATFVAAPDLRFDPSKHDVVEIADDRSARDFVITHHYAGSWPAAWRRFGLYRDGGLVGVAVFSVPVRMEALKPLPLNAAAELGRFVLLDDVAFNAETWMLARCSEVLRRDGLAGFVSFSDPFARTAADGRVVFPGHAGQIYAASNAVYLGRSDANTLYLLPDGRVFSRRAVSKIRARDQGWRYSVDLLVSAGAAPHENTSSAEALAAWLDAALPSVTRRVRHPGNLKFAFGLTPRVRASLPASLPYPRIARPSCAPSPARCVVEPMRHVA